MKKLQRKIEDIIYTDNILVFVSWFAPTCIVALIMGAWVWDKVCILVGILADRPYYPMF